MWEAGHVGDYWKKNILILQQNNSQADIQTEVLHSIKHVVQLDNVAQVYLMDTLIYCIIMLTYITTI